MSSTAITAQELISNVERLVGEELLVVTYKWLSRKYCIDADFSKRVLFDFVSKHAERVNAVYLLGGWAKDSRSHVIQLVPHVELEVRKKLLEPVTSLHVYSVAPKQKTQTPVDIWAVNHEQTRELYKRMMEGDDSAQVRCLSKNACGGISFDGADRIVRKASISISPPTPVEEKPAAKPDASKSDVAQKPPLASSKPKKKRGKSNIKQAFSRNAQSKSGKEEEPPPEPSIEAKNSLMVDAEDALKNADDNMDDSEDDDIVFRQRSSATLGRSKNRMQLEDDEVEEPESPRLPDENDEKDSCLTQRDEKDSCLTQRDEKEYCLTQRVGSISLTQQENGSEENGKGSSAEENQQVETNTMHMEMNPPTTSGKIVTRKKVVKVYYDDDGCEATEEVWEDVVRDVEDVARPSPSSTQTAKRKSKTQESEPSAKRQKSGKVKSGSQRSIMSFFGKK